MIGRSLTRRGGDVNRRRGQCARSWAAKAQEAEKCECASRVGVNASRAAARRSVRAGFARLEGDEGGGFVFKIGNNVQQPEHFQDQLYIAMNA